MAENSFLRSLKKSKSSKQLTVGSGTDTPYLLDGYDVFSTFNFVYDNAEMEDNMDVDMEDRKYCLGDMSIGFEEDTSNEEIKVTLYQEDHKALCNKMDVAVKEKTPITETRVVDSTLKVNLDQFIADVMHTENMYVAIESHSFESYQIMNLSEENPMKVNDTTSLKTGFCVVGRK
ncbi:hypothetical protein Tco_1193384 [Tanacetum coccineum]